VSSRLEEETREAQESRVAEEVGCGMRAWGDKGVSCRQGAVSGGQKPVEENKKRPMMAKAGKGSSAQMPVPWRLLNREAGQSWTPRTPPQDIPHRTEEGCSSE
jgi:hypothetical protein